MIEFRIVCEGEHTVSKHLESLYQNLLNGKLPHNLSWAEAVELVEHGPGEPESTAWDAASANFQWIMSLSVPETKDPFGYARRR